MSRLRILATGAALITATALGVVSPAWAAAPSNDTSAGATTALDGFSEEVDTTEATTDAEDAQFNESCGVGHTDASVWYTIEGTDNDIAVDTYSGSTNYSTAVLVGVGSPGNLQTVTCSFGGATFYAEAGTTYYILVVDIQSDETINGGTLNISFRAVPPPTIELTVNASGTVSKATGTARISGTYTCTPISVNYRVLGGSVTQTIKQRVPVTTYASLRHPGNLLCDGVRHTWAADAIPDEGGGVFRAGTATVDASAVVCEINCAFDQVTRNVTLALKK